MRVPLSPLTKPLALGTKDDQVKVLQQMLVDQGKLNQAYVTGVFDQPTETALKEYQCANGIVCAGTPGTTGYGSAGPSTRAKLNALVQGGTTTLTTSATTTGKVKVTLTRNLYRGLKHTEVTKLQSFLVSLGYLSGDSATGYFGVLTEAAVKKYQCATMQLCSGSPSVNGYGSVGPKTRGMMGR